MPLPSILRRKTPAAASTPPETSPEAARTRARRRLIGAVLLLGIGVIAFPLLFETEPRPIPVDLPIEIPKKDDAPPLAMPSAPAPAASVTARPAPPPMITESPADPVPAASAPLAVVPAPASAPASATSRADGARAQALLEGRAASAPASTGRYVVQIGAFAEEKAVREVRAKAQKAGLETYTQVITPAAGPRTRVRIGPFPRREDAEAAAAKAQKAGLTASVIKL